MVKNRKTKNFLMTLVLLGLATPLVVFNLYSAANATFGFAVSANSTNTSAGGDGVTTNIVPGTMTSYGVTLDNAGYQKLLQYDSSINPGTLASEHQATLKKLLGRDENGKKYIPHPCCDGAISECAPCGHGAASRGLIKYLLQQGWSEKDILQEAIVWDKMFFPGQV